MGNTVIIVKYIYCEIYPFYNNLESLYNTPSIPVFNIVAVCEINYISM